MAASNTECDTAITMPGTYSNLAVSNNLPSLLQKALLRAGREWGLKSDAVVVDDLRRLLELYFLPPFCVISPTSTALAQNSNVVSLMCHVTSSSFVCSSTDYSDQDGYKHADATQMRGD